MTPSMKAAPSGRTIKYCARCCTPNTRPRIEFDAEGVCNACRFADEKKRIDWEARKRELVDLVAPYRRPDGYECIVPVSGGKDSHFQTHFVTTVLGLRPLCVTFVPALPTEVGNLNRRNLVEKLGVDHLAITPNPHVHRKLCRIMFVEHGNPFVPWTQGIFSAVTQVAIEKRIPLLFYGENGELEYGGQTSGSAGASIQSTEGVRLRVRSSRPNWKDPEDWVDHGLERKDILLYQDPPDAEKERVGIRRLFLGDYVPWNNNHNLHVALNVVGGFRLLDRRTVGTYTHGTSIDDDIDELYLWMLWPKFGFHRASKSASPDIREGKLTRERAVELVKLYDGEFPWYVFDRVLAYLDMDEPEFWSVVERFVGDEDNLRREEELAVRAGLSPESLPNRVPAWIKVDERRWRHAGTIHGEERYLELPLPRPGRLLSGG